MADLGNVGLYIRTHTSLIMPLSPYQAREAITTIAITGATASAQLLLVDASGRAVLGSAMADGSGNASFYNAETGTYYVHEPATTKSWRIEVDASRVATVTRVSPGTVASVGST